MLCHACNGEEFVNISDDMSYCNRCGSVFYTKVNLDSCDNIKEYLCCCDSLSQDDSFVFVKAEDKKEARNKSFIHFHNLAYGIDMSDINVYAVKVLKHIK